ncbi:MAG: hypothetical protein AAFX99_13190 [Myxococcota bacterium]
MLLSIDPSATERVILSCRALPDWYRAHKPQTGPKDTYLMPLWAAEQLERAVRQAALPKSGDDALFDDVRQLLHDLLDKIHSTENQLHALHLQRDVVPIYPDHVCTVRMAQRALVFACMGVEMHSHALLLDAEPFLIRIDALLGCISERIDTSPLPVQHQRCHALAERAVFHLNTARRIAVESCGDTPALLDHLKAVWGIHAPRTETLAPPRRRTLVVTGRCQGSTARRSASI